MEVCYIEHCNNKAKTTGLCGKHYQSKWKYGDPLYVEKYGSPKPMKNKALPYEETHKVIDNIEHKLCRQCEEWLPMTKEYFYKKKSSKTDGYDTYCKKCAKERADQWRRGNPEKHDKAHRKYRKTSKNYRKYVRRNFEHQRDSGYAKRYREENKEKIAEYNRNRQLHRKHEISQEELNELYEYCDSKCMYCGMKEEESKEIYGQVLHKDHANNDGSNKIDNCVLACKGCNVAKYTRDWDEWFTPDNERYTEEKYIMIKNWLDRFK